MHTFQEDLNVQDQSYIKDEHRNMVASPMAQQVKNPPAMQETQVTRLRSLGQEYPLEGEKAAHSGILAQKTPWTEDPGGPHSERSQRVKRD